MKWEVNSKRQQELVQDIREKFAPRLGIHLEKEITFYRSKEMVD